nr:PREDICTED: protein SYS1 homolog [Bemisia tabaci]
MIGGISSTALFSPDRKSMAKLSGHFRNTQWDPLLISVQIIAIQSLYYFMLGLWLSILSFLLGTPKTLDHLFRYQEMHVRDFSGKMIVIAFVLNALSGACSLWFVVQRTKLCLDFTVTTHFIHLLACWYYNGHFPFAFSWWVLNIACTAIMCVCAEFLCLRTQLKEIPLNVGQKVDL